MDKFKKKNIKKFVDIESPNRLTSYEERTGKAFEPEVNHKIIDIGNGYGRTEPLKKDRNNQSD